jgi:sRNA-binding regulator protein Hfq
VNRKLIRTTLADVKNRETTAPPRERFDGPREGREGAREYVPREGREYVPRSGPSSHSRPMSPGGSSAARDAALAGRKRIPPAETNAEIFYYKKQMDAHTPMVIVLLDGEEVEGTIEWYDRAALKINRRGEPNILLLKHQIKYMFKAEDRDGGGDDDDTGD